MAKSFKIGDFMNSRWMELARHSDAEKKVRKEFHKWVKKGKNSQLVKRAQQLWDYMNSGKVSAAEKVLIVAALLYLISPVDMIPDFIPVAGLLDDVTIAGLVLDYVLKKMDDKGEGNKGKKRSKPGSNVGPILQAVAKAMSKKK